MIKSFLLIIVGFSFLSCGGGISQEQVIGDWMLVTLEISKDSPHDSTFQLPDCDKQSVWHFLNEDDEPLDDGTATKKLVVTGASGCDFRDKESKWTIFGGKLFISSTSVGGIGGISNAGQFNVKEITGNKLVLEMWDCIYTFEKIN